MSKRRLVVAVSGGVDSIVLLDLLAKSSHELAVAHFDHGIRPDSARDAAFVKAVAARYDLPFFHTREVLGVSASEEKARNRRYEFLFDVAQKFSGTVVTAHHQGDVLETIALNIERGTGWRGLAAFGNRDVLRPLLGITKQQIYQYATKHRLEWVEDSSNQNPIYTRNRLRKQLNRKLHPEAEKTLVRLWRVQREKRDDIDDELEALSQIRSRYFLTMIDEDVAIELLNWQIKATIKMGVTRPSLKRLLMAIKVAQPGTRHDATAGVFLEVKKDRYLVRKS